MGCNCKGGKAKKLNNLDSTDHLQMAKEVMDRIITQKSFEELDEFDWMELYSVWEQMYPYASGKPSKEQLIVDIQNAVALLQLKYTKKTKR